MVRMVACDPRQIAQGHCKKFFDLASSVRSRGHYALGSLFSTSRSDMTDNDYIRTQHSIEYDVVQDCSCAQIRYVFKVGRDDLVHGSRLCRASPGGRLLVW